MSPLSTAKSLLSLWFTPHTAEMFQLGPTCGMLPQLVSFDAKRSVPVARTKRIALLVTRVLRDLPRDASQVNA